MLNLYQTSIEELFIHTVGNKCKKEELFLTDTPLHITDEMSPLLKEFFFKPFRTKEETYFEFSDMAEEALLKTAIESTTVVDSLKEMSHDIARHLYDCSNHPHIKSGELYIASLEGIVYNNEKITGLGIFKSEIKSDYLQFQKNKSQLELQLEQGVNLEKLDKGALILNTPEGTRVMYIDSNRYDSKYWVDNFLGLEECEDENYYTKKYLKFCQDFSKDVVRAAEDKQSEIDFMNKTLHHFASNDQFSQEHFMTEVLEDPEMVNEFEHYQREKGMNDPSFAAFDVSNNAVSVARNAYRKNVIELDTGMTIKIPKGTPNTDKYLEKGWDEERQMYYYLVYFNKEER